MPSKPLLGSPVVVGISDAVIAIRRVVSAETGCCDPSKATRAEAQEICRNRIWLPFGTKALWVLNANYGPNVRRLASFFHACWPDALPHVTRSIPPAEACGPGGDVATRCARARKGCANAVHHTLRGRRPICRLMIATSLSRSLAGARHCRARKALRPIFTISLDPILSVALEAGRDRGLGQGRFSFRLELGS